MCLSRYRLLQLRGRADCLPTGRNFYSVDNRAVPTPTAWELGRKSAENLLVRHFQDPRVSAVQGRCIVRNSIQSKIARSIAIDYFSGYLVNEYGRQALFELPAYGGANCAVRASTLRELFGTDRVAFVATNSAGAERSYSRLSEIADEIVDARVWSGIHFRNTDVQGAKIGREVARWRRQHGLLRPLHHHR